MPDLIAKSALEGRSLSIAGTTLAEAQIGPITSIAPFPGQAKAVAKALKPLGLGFPAPNGSAIKGSAALLWTGRDQAFLIGAAAPAFGDAAAITDQTGGWCALRLTGPHATDALMRLVPLDLRASAYPPGTCTRTALNHMGLILLRETDGFLILTFRSMAETAWHEVENALHALAARASL